MSDHVNAFRGFIGGAVVGALLWLLICWAGFGLWCYFNPCRDVGVAPREIRARMAYHGVDVAYLGWDGQLWFERDGRKCKL